MNWPKNKVAVSITLIGLFALTVLVVWTEKRQNEALPQEFIDRAFGEGYKGVVGAPTGTDEKWAIKIPLRSQTNDLVISNEPWMENPTKYDQELTDLEKKIKDQEEERKDRWHKVLTDGVLLEKERSEITNRVDELQKEKKIAHSFGVLFKGLLDDREQVIWGTLGAHATPEQLSSLQPLWIQLISLSGDKEFLLEKQISTLQDMLTSMDMKDEERLSDLEVDVGMLGLVYSWHADGFTKLNNQELEFKKNNNLPQ